MEIAREFYRNILKQINVGYAYYDLLRQEGDIIGIELYEKNTAFDEMTRGMLGGKEGVILFNELQEKESWPVCLLADLKLECKDYCGEKYVRELSMWYHVRFFDVLEGGYVILLQDITEQKNLEIKLTVAKEEAEMLNLIKNQFIANMSHEIRTPMNGIIGFAELLNQMELNMEQQECVKEIKGASETLLYLVNDVLDYSRIEAREIKLENNKFNLFSVIEEVIRFFEQTMIQKNIQIQIEIEKNVPEYIKGDARRLRQVLNNIFGNAVKFTDSGRIDLEVSCFQRGDQELLQFRIRDTGIGITEVQKARIFELFSQADSSTTRKYGGTGLGLAISKKLVELSGGEIGVESQLGYGTIVHFTIVYEDAYDLKALIHGDGQNERPAIQLSEEDSLAENRCKHQILLAEDNEMNRRLMIKLLNNAGYNADTVENGREVIDLCKRKEYDIIFMDCQMPVMDGYEATEGIRRGEGGTENRRTPIIALTANALEGDKERCIESGMDDYIPKPIRMEDIKRVIDKFLGKKTRNNDFRFIVQEEVKESMEYLSRNAGFTITEASNLLTEYFKELDDNLPAYAENLRKYEFIELGKGAHSLKGSSGTSNLRELAEIARNMEMASAASDFEECGKNIQLLNKYVKIVNEHLENQKENSIM